MAETLAQKRARQHNERIEARECIDRVQAIIDFANRVGVNAQTTAGAKLLDIERLIERYRQN